MFTFCRNAFTIYRTELSAVRIVAASKPTTQPAGFQAKVCARTIPLTNVYDKKALVQFPRAIGRRQADLRTGQKPQLDEV